MRRGYKISLVCLSMFLSACATPVSPVSVVAGNKYAEPSTTSTHSSIVSAMNNHYKENPELAIDPCHDTFIHNMQSIGFVLQADKIQPEGRKKFSYWFATCAYWSNTVSTLVESATAPFMKKKQTLEPTNDMFDWAHFIDINGRKAIARPYVNNIPHCMLSIDTSFGSMTLTGGPRINTDSTDPCGKIEKIARQIEPWIDD